MSPDGITWAESWSGPVPPGQSFVDVRLNIGGASRQGKSSSVAFDNFNTPP